MLPRVASCMISKLVWCWYECHVAIMLAYEVTSMHVSKPCYIWMCSSIDEPLWLNASPQHILLTLFLLLKHCQSPLISLSFLFYFPFLILYLKLFLGYDLDSDPIDCDLYVVLLSSFDTMKMTLQMVSHSIRMLLWQRKGENDILLLAWNHVCALEYHGGALILNLYEHIVTCWIIFIWFMFEVV